MRACSECRLCCKVFPLPVLEKPAAAWCRHTCANGCAIHGPAMPEVCRQYDCFWREHDALPDSWRPDRTGIVVTESGIVSVGSYRLPVVLFQQDDFVEGTAAMAEEMLDHFVTQGLAVMMIHGAEARIEFDRDRYPEVSAGEIEAALRYELSQDAEELKRLGAVGDDYRSLSREEAAAACREGREA